MTDHEKIIYVGYHTGDWITINQSHIINLKKHMIKMYLFISCNHNHQQILHHNRQTDFETPKFHQLHNHIGISQWSHRCYHQFQNIQKSATDRGSFDQASLSSLLGFDHSHHKANLKFSLSWLDIQSDYCCIHLCFRHFNKHL